MCCPNVTFPSSYFLHHRRSLSLMGLSCRLKVMSESTSVRPGLEAAARGGALLWAGLQKVAQPAWAFSALCFRVSHFSLRHWFLSRPSDHTPASGAEQTSSDVCKLQKSFHRETVIKQVLTGLCVCIKMMQSNDNNLVLRLNSKFNLSL